MLQKGLTILSQVDLFGLEKGNKTIRLSQSPVSPSWLFPEISFFPSRKRLFPWVILSRSISWRKAYGVRTFPSWMIKGKQGEGRRYGKQWIWLHVGETGTPGCVFYRAVVWGSLPLVQMPSAEGLFIFHVRTFPWHGVEDGRVICFT